MMPATSFTRRALPPLAKSPLKTLFIRKRQFHSGSRLQSSVLETCCTQSFEIINTIHSTTGLSWVYILPISAILLRTAVVVPLNVWSKIHLNKMQEIHPLLLAWGPKIAEDVRKEYPRTSPVESKKIIKQRHKEKSAELRTRFGINKWAPYSPLLQMPFFLVAMETIRQMSSTRTGFFDFLSQWLPFLSLESKLPIELSFSNEGGLWFTDLLVPDPYHILPVTVAAMLYSTVAYQDRLQRAKTASVGRRSKAISIVLKVLAVGTIPLTLGFPAAMLVYWASSSAYALICSYFIEKAIPTQPIIVPCPPLKKTYLLKSAGEPGQNGSGSFWSRFRKDNL